MKKILLLTSISLFIILISGKRGDLIRTGMKPVYVSNATAYNIEFLAPQPINNSGKIYIYNQYVLINEQYKGIHVINNLDNTNPQKTAFISIPGNIDISVKNGFLYADNYDDLVVINLNNPAEPVLVKRLQNVFTNMMQTYPVDYHGYFECVNPDSGFVTGWVEAQLINPKCRR